jgi:hypothetical protein
MHLIAAIVGWAKALFAPCPPFSQQTSGWWARRFAPLPTLRIPSLALASAARSPPRSFDGILELSACRLFKAGMRMDSERVRIAAVPLIALVVLVRLGLPLLTVFYALSGEIITISTYSCARSDDLIGSESTPPIVDRAWKSVNNFRTRLQEGSSGEPVISLSPSCVFKSLNISGRAIL